MRSYILASHGFLAKGMLETLELIVGKNRNIYTVCAYSDDLNPEKNLKDLIRNLSKLGEVIIFTDLFGGSVNNILMKMIQNNIYLFAGMNLPLILSAVLSEDMDISTLVQKLKMENTSSIVYCNDLTSEDEEDF